MKIIVTLGLGVAMSSTAFAGSATFELWNNTNSANDMSSDGNFVTGNGAGGSYIWTPGDGFTFIGTNGFANAISDDGTLIFGNMVAVQEAGIWNTDDDWTALGGLGESCGSTSSGYELSDDGTVGVGLGWESCSGRGFRWTLAEGMQQLETLGNGGNRSSVVSADGSVMAGFAQSNTRTPAVWYADLSGMLLDPTGDAAGEVRGISDDGTILLGNWNGEAFTWTEKDGVTLHGRLFPDYVTVATDIADDGTLVGYASFVQAFFAWIKPAGGEMQRMDTYLESLGAGEVPHLDFCQAISRDGTRVIGQTSRFPSIGWMATLPGSASCDGDVDGDGAVTFDDLLIVLSEWGPCPGCDGDVDGDDDVDFDDLLIVLSAWGPCP